MWGPVLFLNKLSNSAKKYKYVLIFWANQKNTETFRCEKSAWNTIVSGTFLTAESFSVFLNELYSIYQFNFLVSSRLLNIKNNLSTF